MIGEGTTIGPYCIIGPNVVIGANCKLIAHVHVTAQTTIGADCTIYPVRLARQARRKILSYRGRADPARDRRRLHHPREPSTMNVGTVKAAA